MAQIEVAHWDPPTTPASVLERALGALDQHGWGRGRLVDKDTGCLCAIGALYAGAIGYDALTLEHSPGTKNFDAELPDAEWELLSERWKLTGAVFNTAQEVLRETLAVRLHGDSAVADLVSISDWNDRVVPSEVEVRATFQAALERTRATQQ